jgi:hypothetical protein
MQTTDPISFGLAFTKYIGIFLSAGSGVLGLLVEYKEDYTDAEGNKRKRVTFWGKVALSGILLGALLSTTSEVFSGLKARAQSAQELARANRVLNEINRSINVIQNPVVSWEMELALDDPSLAGLRDGLDKAVSEIRSTVDGRTDCGGYYRYDSPDRPRTIRFTRSCAAIPSFDGTGLGNLLHTFGLAAKFVRPVEGSAVTDTPSLPADLSFQVSAYSKVQVISTSASMEVGGPNYHFEYDLTDKKLMLCGDEVVPDNWLSDGKILAVPDLAGSQLWVSPTYIVFNKAESAQKDVYDRLRAHLTLRGMTLKFDKQAFRLAGTGFKVQIDDKGQRRFYMRFPDTLETLRVGFRKWAK